jgi:nitrogen fixation NifU-like protein
VGKVGNPVCGDMMELFLKVDGDVIQDVKFRTFGCGAAIATSSMVTELVKGKTLEEALTITNKTVAEALGGLPKQKMHCSVLGEEALDAAIYDYLEKNDLRPDLRALIEEARAKRKPKVDDPHGVSD